MEAMLGNIFKQYIALNTNTRVDRYVNHQNPSYIWKLNIQIDNIKTREIWTLTSRALANVFRHFVYVETSKDHPLLILSLTKL